MVKYILHLTNTYTIYLPNNHAVSLPTKQFKSTLYWLLFPDLTEGHTTTIMQLLCSWIQHSASLKSLCSLRFTVRWCARWVRRVLWPPVPVSYLYFYTVNLCSSTTPLVLHCLLYLAVNKTSFWYRLSHFQSFVDLLRFSIINSPEQKF